jgi:hypothetical protein
MVIFFEVYDDFIWVPVHFISSVNYFSWVICDFDWVACDFDWVACDFDWFDIDFG